MKRHVITAALVILTLVWTFDAQAGWGRNCNKPAAWQGMWNCTPGVTLTTEQSNNLNSLQQSFFKDTAALKTKLAEKRLAMNSLLLEPVPDSDKVIHLQKETSDLQARYDEKILSYQLQARKILSPDQIAQLPLGCTMGFGNMLCGSGAGCGHGRRCGKNWAFGHGSGCW